MNKKLILCAAFLVAAVADTFACTNLIVGKNASADGSTIVSYSADSYGLFGELYHYPAATYKKGTMLDVYEWDTGKYLGKIEQARQTYHVHLLVVARAAAHKHLVVRLQFKSRFTVHHETILQSEREILSDYVRLRRPSRVTDAS